ncbi:MAG: YitT family protein, partial [Clostridia bacterium]|nr:YitT family protein [Clostridia bacterium]
MKKVMTYLMIIGLAVVCALNYQLFVAPNSFAPSGLTGICTMIRHLTGINVGYLSLLINVPLAIMAWKSINKSMAVRSMIYVLANSLALIVLGSIDLSAFIYSTANGTSTILGPLVAGVINGSCFSLLFKYSASSGGIDFIAAVIR